MSTRKLNVPELGFEIVVIGASDKTNKAIADALEKKVVEEAEDNPCKECGMPDLDGLWYTGLCEMCHDELVSRSVKSAVYEIQNTKKKSKKGARS
jgi:hypothetical protein